MLRSWRARVAPLLALVLLGGCTTIQYNEYRQPVKFASQPYGTKVYQDGRYLGTTPDLLSVRRGVSPDVTLITPDGKTYRQELKTRYRWGESFWMNCLLFSIAPVGWGLDLLTGTAWRVEDPPTLPYTGKPGPEPKPEEVAVVPPVMGDMDFSDALGVVIAGRLRDEGRFKVLSYLDSAPVFQYYGSEGALTENLEDRYRLLRELNADYVFLAKAKAMADGSYAVNGELKNPLTGHVARTYDWEISPREGNLRRSISTHKLFSDYFHLLPNTVFLTSSNYNPNMTIGLREYAGKEAPAENFLDEVTRYLSAVTFANLERPRANVRGHWTFDFVPTVGISRKTILFDEYPPLAGVEFRRTVINGGYGIETGYLSRYGFAYLNLIPALTWTKLDYQTDFVSGSLARWSVQLVSEIGYTYFLSEHFVLRLFGRTFSENAELWNEAFTHVIGSPIESSSVNSVSAGLSIGYYIPSSLTRREAWTIRPKR